MRPNAVIFTDLAPHVQAAASDAAMKIARESGVAEPLEVVMLYDISLDGRMVIGRAVARTRSAA